MTAVVQWYLNGKADNFRYFQLGEDKQFLIVGDSHPECAFNDSIIYAGANFAASAESYFYIYAKVKQLIKYNKQIKHVLVEFNNGQIEKGMNELIWSEKYLMEVYPKYASFLDADDYTVLLKNNSGSLLPAHMLALKKNITFLFIDRGRSMIHYRNWGGYLRLTHDQPQVLEAAMDKPSVELDHEIETSKTNLAYLRKIIALCRLHQVSVHLIRTPVHPAYSGLANEKTYQRVVTERFSGVSHLDFRNFTLAPGDFADFHHLNHRGAKKFSIFFQNLVEHGVLDSPNGQQMIEDNLAKVKLDAAIVPVPVIH